MDLDLEVSDIEEYPDDENDKDFDINEYKSTGESDDYPESDNDNENDEEQDEEQVEEDEGYTGPILPGGHRFDKKLTCIRYPGNVVNPDKAVETLGGIGAISTAVSTPNRRLELRFRPADGYCKPACGDRHEVTGFLLQIRTKKSRVQSINESSLQKEQESYRDLESAMPQSSSNPYLAKTLENLEHQIKNCTVNSKTNQQKNSSNIEKNTSEKSNSPLPGEKKSHDDILPTFEKNKYEDLSNDKDYVLPKLKVLGRVETEFKFTNLCDFQFLPVMKKTNDSPNECIYNSIYPSGIPSYKWLQQSVPYFLPPAIFSRMDTVQNYSLKTETKNSGSENIIGKTRKRRGGFPSCISFTADEVPTEPPSGIENAMSVKFLGTRHLETIKTLFEQRPIWSRNALMYKTNFSSEQLKLLLPCVAYYFTNGPWRIMWVRLGFDPRIIPAARIYQTLDFRVKHMHGLEQNVKGKRRYTNYTLPYKTASGSRAKTKVLTDMGKEKKTKRTQQLSEDCYIYRKGIIPPSKQMFYQYCDIHTDEIQEMMAKLPDPQPGTKCDEKRGWLPAGFNDQCREIINKQLRVVIRKNLNLPLDHPTTLPRRRLVKPNKVKSSSSNGEDTGG